MKYIEIESENYWYYYYDMEIMESEKIDYVFYSVHDEDDENFIVNIELHAKQSLENDDINELYDSEYRAQDLFIEKRKQLLDGEIDYFIATASYLYTGEAFFVDEIEHNVNVYGKIANEKWLYPRIKYIKVFVNEEESLEFHIIQKWTRKIFSKFFDYEGNFKIATIPDKNTVCESYDKLEVELIDKYNEELAEENATSKLKYTKQAHIFFFIICCVYFFINSSKGYATSSIYILFFTFLSGIYYVKCRFHKSFFYFIWMLLCLILVMRRIIEIAIT